MRRQSGLLRWSRGAACRASPACSAVDRRHCITTAAVATTAAGATAQPNTTAKAKPRFVEPTTGTDNVPLIATVAAAVAATAVVGRNG